MNNNISLYKRHKIIYTDPVPGKFSKIRILSMTFMALCFFLTPWIKYDDHQIFIFDLSNIRFYFLKFVFWPQDFVFFALIGILTILSLFTITVYSGRIWCGFLCPQSIWIRLANFLTRLIEGNRNKRLKLNFSDFRYTYIYKKIIKHILLICLSFLTSITFIGYFIPILSLIQIIFSYSISTWSFFWTFFFSIITYFNIYWFKEQFCFLVCPYARLQSVMFDNNTLIVSYDSIRGEKRGNRSKGTNYKAQGLGDCIDCKKCVNCCPTGIDIRDGLQIECISCGECIDACDSVMEKMGYNKGLIKYSRDKQNNKLNIRFLAYIFLLVILSLILSYGLYKRDLIQLNIIKSQIQLYNITKDDIVENFYVLKIVNKTRNLSKYKIHLCNSNFKYTGLNEIILQGEETLLLDVKISIKKENISENFTEILFKINNAENKNDYVIKKSKFISPI